MNNRPDDREPCQDRATLLRERARELARPAVDETQGDDQYEVVEFTVSRQRVSVETTQVREVCRLQELTPVPCTPAFVCGIVNVRGQILTVLDLGRLLDLPDSGLIDRQHVVIVRADGVELGLLADGMPLVRRIRTADVQPSLPTLGGGGSAYLRGVTVDGLALLDTARLLSDPRLVVHQEVASSLRSSTTTGDSAS
jgi:purine-binding chemotaxis protein CheW